MPCQKKELSCSSLYDRVKKLLVSFEWSDCSFSLSGKDFKAHKLILGISSPVFEAMFYGPMSSNDSVIITDIQPEIFQILLTYLYTDKVELASIEDAFELLYASEKYMLEQLSDLCTVYIQANMSIDNVTTILNYPDYMQSEELFTSALKLFCEHANYLLPINKNLITLSNMKNIVQCDQINIMEKDLIKAVFDWISVYCEQNNFPVDIKNKRDVLIKNDMFQSLRFLTLPESHIEEIIQDGSNLLLKSEIDIIKDILKNRMVDIESFPQTFNTHNCNTLGTNMSPRNSLKIDCHLCIRSPLKSVKPIVIDSNNYVVYSRLKASKSLFITTLCVPTRMSPLLSFRSNMPNSVYSEQITISIVCESDNSINKVTYFMNTVNYDSLLDIELIEPYLIKKDKWYKICFEWPRIGWFTNYSYVVECRDKFYRDSRVDLEFEDMLVTGNNRSFLGGLKYCL